MAVIITNMEMPKSCGDCRFQNSCGYGYGYGRSSDCPLEEVKEENPISATEEKICFHEMRNKIYRVNKGNRTPEFAWQLTCNNAHVQWFSDEAIARRTCDELNHQELIKENGGGEV